LTGGRAAPLVLASSNPGKLAEFRALLAGLPIALRGLGEFPGISLPDEGDVYEENARAKAARVATATGLPALADDSGIEVAALGQAPGPRSARYGGPGLDDAGRVAHLLAALEASGASDRSARFVCIAALALPDGRVFTTRGECPGRIRASPSGAGGFGYDPVFEPCLDGRPRGCTMAELGGEEKNRISHRGRAVAALVPWIRRHVAGGD
jgi:XTP/dITP diphosphohydrolase